MSKFSLWIRCFAKLAAIFTVFFQSSQITSHGFVKVFEKNNSDTDLSVPFKQCREYRFEGENTSNHISASDNENNFLVSYKNGTLIYLSAVDFQLLWSSDLGLKISSNIVFDSESFFLVVEAKNQEGYLLKQINKSAGLPEWQAKINLSEDLPTDKFTDKSTDNFQINFIKGRIIVVSHSGEIFCYDKNTKKLIWTRTFKNNLSSLPFATSDNVFVSINNKTIARISTANGGIINKITTTNTVPTVLIVTSNESIIYGDKNGNVYSIDEIADTTNWKIRFGAGITSIVQTPLGLLISSADNFTYLIQNRNGKRVWKKRMAGRVLQKPLILDDYVIMTNYFNPEALLIDLKKGKIVNRINLYKENFFTGDIIFNNNLLIFSTTKGIISYAPFSQNCPEPEKRSNN
jgi:outer membrane protein assembly factor BamB